MKTLLNLGNGAFTITEQAGEVTFSFSEKASLGGGSVAGLLKVQGEGSVILEGKQGLDAAAAAIEAVSPPALVPIEEGVKDVVDGVVSAL